MAGGKKASWLRSLNESENYPLKPLENSSSVFCQVCEQAVGASMKSQLQQHLFALKHKKNAELKKKTLLWQVNLEDMAREQRNMSKADIVGKELYKALASANVPLWKLENRYLRPLASTDVERSFSQYKTILTNNRQSFRKENLAMVIVTNCFYSRQSK